MLIVQHELGAQQIRSAELSATEIDTVTRTARHRVHGSAALDDRRIRELSLLGGENRRPAAPLPASAFTTAWRRLRLRRRRWWRLALSHVEGLCANMDDSDD